MAHQISKSLVKKAWRLTEGVGRQIPPPQRSQLITAATSLALIEYREQIHWIQEPPPQTILEIEDQTVRLTFDPTAGVTIKARYEEQEISRAEAIVSPWQDLKAALQCIGLRSLEGDIEWKSPPPFEFE